MKKKNKWLTSPVFLVIVFAAAVLLLSIGSIGGARAALTYYSDSYASQLEMQDIGVSLLENGEKIASRDYKTETADGTWEETTGELLSHMLEESDGTLQLGRKYTESLSVQNSGTIGSYVRVTIYKYWLDEDGNKIRNIDPSVIDLHLVNLTSQDSGEQCWIEDTAAETAERTVLYYNKMLPSTESTPEFSDTLCIDSDVSTHIKQEKDDNGVITDVYEYNGQRFVVEATVDAVQDHNARAAILSAWGIKVNVDDGKLSLQ